MADSRFSLADLCYVIGEPVRWRMLAELIDGEPRTTTEFARLNRTSDSAASKHLNVLRGFGIIETRHRVHYLAARYRPAPGTREIDFGGCVMRLSEPSWLKPQSK